MKGLIPVFIAGFATLPVAADPSTTTYQQGSVIYLQSVANGNTVRVGVDTSQGAAITEMSLNGVNYVNTHDLGRLIQVSIGDLNIPGYNPNQAGDVDFHASPVSVQEITNGTIHTVTQMIQWEPELFGGSSSPGGAVPTDFQVEQWVSAVPGYPQAFKVHYKITNFGSDSHASVSQQIPCVYVNLGLDSFAYYGGSKPWTNDSLTQATMPNGPPPSGSELWFYAPELWGAFADTTGSGLTVYMPGSYPWITGFHYPHVAPDGTNTFVGAAPMGWDPGTSFESDVYLFSGKVTDARTAIYDLHSRQQNISQYPPFGFLDQPKDGSPCGGTVPVQGWAIGLSPIKDIGVFVDGVRVGTASYGMARPDVPTVFPDAPSTAGFAYPLCTTTLSNGIHTVQVKVADGAGGFSTFASKHIAVTNSISTYSAPASRLVNISARAAVGTGANILIAGFAVRGSGGKTLLLRGVGPTLGLAPFSVPGSLAQAELELFSGSQDLLAINTTWGGSQVLSNAFARSGAFAESPTSADSALVVTLSEGAYTSQLSGVSAMTGVGLAEIYDSDTNIPTADVINLSARGYVGTGANILIAGFVIQGSQPLTILLRGVGPTLGTAPFNVPGSLFNTTVGLFDSSGTLIASNAGWSTAPAKGASTLPATIRQVTATDMATTGAFALPAGSADSAMVATLPPGAYTLEVSGQNGFTGVALVEVYVLPN